MKAVVVEIRDGFAAVLSDDGRIVKVKNQNYVIGQVIVTKEAVKRKLRFIPAAAAAAAVLICGTAGAGAYTYYTPYSYVSLDVNPSIEYSLNRFDRVLEVTGVNDDGEEIVRELKLDSLSNKKIDEVIARTVKQIADEGLFAGELGGGVVISASAKDLKKASELAEDLKQDAEDATEDENVTVESFPVGLERVQEAHELGVTPGKLNLVEKLRDSAETPDDVDLQEWLNKPVKEIMQGIKENRKTAKAGKKSPDEGAASSQDTSSADSAPSSANPASNSSSGENTVSDKPEKQMVKPESKDAKAKSRPEEKQEKQTCDFKNQETREKMGKAAREKQKPEKKSAGRLDKPDKKDKPDKPEKRNGSEKKTR